MKTPSSGVRVLVAAQYGRARAVSIVVWGGTPSSTRIGYSGNVTPKPGEGTPTVRARRCCCHQNTCRYAASILSSSRNLWALQDSSVAGRQYCGAEHPSPFAVRPNLYGGQREPTASVSGAPFCLGPSEEDVQPEALAVDPRGGAWWEVRTQTSKVWRRCRSRHENARSSEVTDTCLGGALVRRPRK